MCSICCPLHAPPPPLCNSIWVHNVFMCVCVCDMSVCVYVCVCVCDMSVCLSVFVCKMHVCTCTPMFAIDTHKHRLQGNTTHAAFLSSYLLCILHIALFSLFSLICYVISICSFLPTSTCFFSFMIHAVSLFIVFHKPVLKSMINLC